MSSGVPLVVCGDAKRRTYLADALAEAGWQGVLSASSMSEVAGLVRGQPNVCLIVDADLADISGIMQGTGPPPHERWGSTARRSCERYASTA